MPGVWFMIRLIQWWSALSTADAAGKMLLSLYVYSICMYLCGMLVLQHSVVFLYRVKTK